MTPAVGFCKIVENRSSSVLLPIICSVIRSGTKIHADEWPSYNALSRNPEYEFYTVSHKYNFVCPESGVHT
jgi:hypothetical protein